MSKIKVLHITRALNLGGAEKNLLQLIKHFDPSSIESHVAYAGQGIYEEPLKSLGAQLFRFASHPPKVKSLKTPVIIFRLANYIRCHGIDVVHTHNFNAQVWGVMAAKLAGAKVIEHVHDPRYEPEEYFLGQGLPVTNQFKKASYFGKKSDQIIVCTRQNKEYILKHNIANEDKVYNLYNGLDLLQKPLHNREEVLEQYDLPQDKKIVLAAMRLSPEKNAAFILDIAKILNKQRSDALFLVAGSGPQLEELKAKAKELGVEQSVRFLGFVENIVDLYGVADVFILPTLRELHSLTMIESLSMSLPVLVSQGAGSNDDFISHGENGYVLNPHQANDWAETIHQLLEDESLAKRIGGAGRALVEKECDIRQTVLKIQNLYTKVLTN